MFITGIFIIFMIFFFLGIKSFYISEKEKEEINHEMIDLDKRSKGDN